VSTARSMPWRKTWVDPAEYAGREARLRDVLMRRAYEVWVSEVSKFFSSSLGCCSSCVWVVWGRAAFGARCHVVWTEKLTAMKSASTDARLDGDPLL
jgi:hypothetical protein